MLAQRSWFDIIYLLGSASAGPQIDGTRSWGTCVAGGRGTQSAVTAPPPRSHLEPVRLILVAKCNMFFISFNPDNNPENYPHRGSLITCSKCRLFLNLGTWLRAGPTFDVADLGCVSCLVAPSRLPSSWISRWGRHWPRPGSAAGAFGFSCPPAALVLRRPWAPLTSLDLCQPHCL